MGRAERTLVDKPVACQKIGNAENLGGFDTFFAFKLRQDRRDPPRKHRFSASRRTHHKNVVTACRRDLDRPFRLLVTSHFGEINDIFFFSGFRLGTVKFPRSVLQKIEDILKIPDRDNINFTYGSSFIAVFSRNDYSFESAFLSGYRQTQNTRDRADVSVQGKFADDHETVYFFGFHAVNRGYYRHRDRQIKAGALLSDACRSQIYRDPVLRKEVSAVDYSRSDALLRLFDGIVRQADDRKGRHTFRNIDFNVNYISVNS